MPISTEFGAVPESNPHAFSTINLLVDSYVRLAERAADEEAAAARDPLTGLFTRSALEAAYQTLQQTKSSQRTIDRLMGENSLLFADVDKFKELNDTQGHTAGDEALSAIGGVLLGRTRDEDTPARWGGDEFIVLLPRTAKEQASKLARDIVRKVAATDIATLSIGVAPVDLDQSLANNIERADLAMYRAKQSGGNTVVRWHESLSPINS